MSSAAVIRIKPQYYVHVLDENTNVTRVVTGPLTFTRKQHEKIVQAPKQMIMVPPRHFCIIKNPVERNDAQEVQYAENGAAILRFGDEEVRIEVENPFPLYPGESLYGNVSPLQVVSPNTALRLRAVRNFQDKQAGDEWLFRGPGTYIPHVEVQVVEIIKAVTIKHNEALRLRARRTTEKHYAGEEWLVCTPGAYLPDVDEEMKETVRAVVLTDKRGLSLEALATFTDVRGVERKLGEQWLVTYKDASTHIPGVFERVLGDVAVTTLTSRQFCVVLDPVDDSGRNQLGKRELRVGEASFFLNPGERLEGGRPQNVYLLDSEEALLLTAREEFVDEKEKRVPGDRWMIFGPRDYTPPVTVEVVEKRRAIPLDENEGIYVRDMKTGKVRAVTGQSYMLSSDEELWKKEVSADVEALLVKEITRDRSGRSSSSVSTRNPTRVITFRIPHNSAVQVYDYKSKTARVVFGPDLVMLGPDEQFTVNSLSGEVPKKPHVIKSLALLLGPDFMTDVVVVETADHARLSLKLSYNWHFEMDVAEPSKIFSVPDFVGDACKAVASRVRGAVATQTFDTFHTKSADIIRDAIFESSETNRFLFTQNNLVITNIDIQSVEPVDSRTRDALQKSVQLAIEITTNSQEASARHEADRREQIARGKLERQKITDEASSEKQRTELLKLQAASAVVEASGQATAEAHARAESMAIEGEAAVKKAQLSAQAEKIRVQSELSQKIAKQEAHISHQTALDDLEIQKANDLAEIEATKFKGIIDAVGASTLEAIATSAPTQQAELLASLNLSSFMVTDGNNPINLFNTAQGLIGGSL